MDFIGGPVTVQKLLATLAADPRPIYQTLHNIDLATVAQALNETVDTVREVQSHALHALDNLGIRSLSPEF